MPTIERKGDQDKCSIVEDKLGHNRMGQDCTLRYGTVLHSIVK